MKITAANINELQAVGRVSNKKNLFESIIAEAVTDGMGVINYPEKATTTQKQSNYRSGLKAYIKESGVDFDKTYKFATMHGQYVLVHLETLAKVTAEAKKEAAKHK